MNRFRSVLIIIFILTGLCSNAQVGFDLQIQESTGWNLPGVHSCALGQLNGKWIYIGGRVNGLHGFEPPFAFPEYTINTSIEVYDTLTKTTYTASLDTLPIELREHLETSNMQFYQQGNTMYFLGGYGWNDSINDFITYPKLTAIDLNGLVYAVMNNQPIANNFRQITDQRFAVTGTWLTKINNTFYLPFGHRFDGIYHKADTITNFYQSYTYAVRKFELDDNGIDIQVNNYSETIDSTRFRRRDLNIVPQIFPDGSFGYTSFSGVFQKNINKPFTYPIDITENNYAVHDTFNQMLSHYHSAHLPVYDSATNSMSTVFFGGMAMYYPDSLGQLVYDSLVPFVKTISCMTRDYSGGLHETYFDQQFPSLLGTNAFFLPVQNSPFDQHGILQLDQLNGNALVGYIISGIESPAENISDNGPELSTASTRIFKVYINRFEDTTSTNFINYTEPFEVKTFPNPTNDYSYVEIKNNINHQAVNIELYDIRMQLVQHKKLNVTKGDVERWKIKASDLPSGTYYIKVSNGRFTRFAHLIITQ